MKQPNLVLIHVDQWRGDCLGIDGHPDVMTPNLDALALEGVRFRRAYSDCPTCIPARHALMTGLKPSVSGLVGFRNGVRIAKPEETLPAILTRAGYQTIDIGRGMHTYPGHARYGFQFCQPGPLTDHYSELRKEVFRQSEKGIFNSWVHRNLHAIGPCGYTSRSWPHEERFHETTYVATRGMEFLDTRDREHPFFLSLGFSIPHPPFVPPRDYLDRYLHMNLQMPHIGDWAPEIPNNGLGYPPDAYFLKLDSRQNHICRAGYYGSITHFDDQITNFFERLAMENEPTYILFTSDHGEMLGDHNQFRKSRVFEGSARIPMLLTGPGLPSGTVVDRPTLLSDILPTFADLAGIAPPASCTGVSLLRQFGQAAPVRSHVHIEHSTLVAEGNHAVTDGHHKFVWLSDTGTELLFDLDNDPQELRNLSNRPESAGELAKWRQILIGELTGRHEGFVQDGGLIAGRPYRCSLPHAVTDYDENPEDIAKYCTFKGVGPWR